MDLTKYRKIFIHESTQYLEALENLLVDAEKDLQNPDLWTAVHGKIHSIKGMARALSMEKISHLSHAMEDWCLRFQQRRSTATPQSVQLLFDGVELLRHLVTTEDRLDSSEVQTRYERLASRFATSPDTVLNSILPENPAQCSKHDTPVTIDHVRVDYALIEELLGFSQEILFSEKTLPSIPEEFGGLRNWIGHYTAQLKGLYFRLAQLRLMSVGEFADLFRKTIRDLARANGKEVDFEVVGGDLHADIALLDHLREPFVHLLRNALAHGIESPAERVSLGKHKAGKILLRAEKKRGNLIIKISDDGRGLDRTAIVEHLKDKASMTEEQIALMSENQLLRTIISPDFSSALETTEMAGRGIGMRVVYESIEHLGGSLTIDSEPLKGTEFSITLPMSLSVIYAITFKVGKYRLSIPTSDVKCVDRVGRTGTKESHPLLDLRIALGLVGREEENKESAQILELATRAENDGYDGRTGPISVIVDRVVANRPLMIMGVGELLARTTLFAGVGIMDNGEISILLDTEKLVELFVHRE